MVHPGQVFASRKIAGSIVMRGDLRRRRWCPSRRKRLTTTTSMQLIFGEVNDVLNTHHVLLFVSDLNESVADPPQVAAMGVCRVPTGGMKFTSLDVLTFTLGALKRTLLGHLNSPNDGPAVSLSDEHCNAYTNLSCFFPMKLADLWANSGCAGAGPYVLITRVLQCADSVCGVRRVDDNVGDGNAGGKVYCASPTFVTIKRNAKDTLSTYLTGILRSQWTQRGFVGGMLPVLLPELIKYALQTECNCLEAKSVFIGINAWPASHAVLTRGTVLAVAGEIMFSGGDAREKNSGHYLIDGDVFSGQRASCAAIDESYERRLAQIVMLINPEQWVPELIVFSVARAFIRKRETDGIHMVFMTLLKINATFRKGRNAEQRTNSTFHAGPSALSTHETLVRRNILHVVKKLTTSSGGMFTKKRGRPSDVVTALQVASFGYLWANSATSADARGGRFMPFQSCQGWALQALLEQHFMFILSHVSDELLARVKMRTGCIRALWCTACLFEVMWQNGYVFRGGGDGYVPKLTTMLKYCMLDTHLRPYACAALCQFSAILSDGKLSSSLSAMVATLVPCIDPVGPFAAQSGYASIAMRQGRLFPAHQHGLRTLRLFVLGCRSNACCPAFACVPSSPQIAALVGANRTLSCFAPRHSPTVSPTCPNGSGQNVDVLSGACSRSLRNVGSICDEHAEARLLLRSFHLLAPLIRHDCEVVQRMALQHVTRALECNKLVLDHAAVPMMRLASGKNMLEETLSTTAASTGSAGTMEEAVAPLYWVIFNIARRAASFSRATRVVCAKCLGELAVIEPVRVARTGPFRGGDISIQGQFGNAELAVSLLRRHLVNDLVGARDTNRQDHVAFAIQQLLRYADTHIVSRRMPTESAADFVGFDNIGMLFSTATRDLIRPYWTTRYQNKPLMHYLALIPANDFLSTVAVSSVVQAGLNSAVSPHTIASKGHDRIRHVKKPSFSVKRGGGRTSTAGAPSRSLASFDMWAHNWSTSLIGHSRHEQGELFRACRGIRSTRMSLFLLPYLVQNVLYTQALGSVVVDGLADEIFRVLAWPLRRDNKRVSTVYPRCRNVSAGDAAPDKVTVEKCTHAIFCLLDQLHVWGSVAKETNVFCSGHPRALGAMMGTPGCHTGRVWFPDKRRLRIWLEGAIPHQILANAAMRCLAHERALLHIEAVMRHKYDPQGRGMHSKKRGPRQTISGNSTSGLRFSHDDILDLHSIYSSIRDEPDGLSGVSVLRVQQCFTPGGITAHERACEYEHAAAWNQALTCYEQQLQRCTVESKRGNSCQVWGRGERRSRLRILRGQLRCLRSVGHLTMIVSLVESEMFRCPELAAVLLPSATEALWRLGRWDDLRDLMESNVFGAEGSGSNPAPQTVYDIGALGGYRIGIARCLLALYSGHRHAFLSFALETQSELLGFLEAASMDSYQRAHPTLVRLHTVRELQHSVELLWHSGVGDTSSVTVRTSHFWGTRLRRIMPSLSTLDEVLSIRHVLYRINGLKCGNACEAQTLLRFARHARVSGHMQAAEVALLKAGELGAPGSRMEKGMLLRAQGRHVLALRELGASGDLEEAPISVHMDCLCGMLSYGKDVLISLSRRAQASLFLLSTSVVHEAGILRGEHILECYKNVTRVDERWECGWFGLGKYYDFLLKEEGKARKAGRCHSCTGIGESGNGGDVSVIHLFLFCTLRYYGHALRLGNAYLHDALPRLLSLWFNHGHETVCCSCREQGDARSKRDTAALCEDWSGESGELELPWPGGGIPQHGFPIISPNAFFLVDDTPDVTAHRGWSPVSVHACANQMRRNALSHGQHGRRGAPSSMLATRQYLDMITGQMQWLSRELAAYQWLAVLPQLVSRVCHTDASVWNILRSVIVHLLHVYPSVAPWMVCGVAGSKHRGRRERACSVLAGWKNTFPRGDAFRKLPSGIRKLFSAMVTLATKAVGARDRKTSLGLDPSLCIPALCLELPRQGMLNMVPRNCTSECPRGVNSAANANNQGRGVPTASSARCCWACAERHDVYLNGFVDVADVMPSKERPKKVVAVCSDGIERNFLCKREARGDLRKDMRMMELSATINRLFSRDRESKRRNLRVRTYAVVCLNEECGLIEWVEDLCSFRQAVKHAYALTGLQQPVRVTKKIKQATERIQTAKESRYTKGEMFQQEVQAVYPPRFYKWFLHQFADPTSWFCSRLHFTRSAAVWAVVGSIIGLGDRHAENILLDVTCGECVHVDFDCIFDKGLSLLMPEIVPFRLTPNMVDGMGVCGYEGVFRRVSEVVMGLLRTERHTVLSVLESFLHDPLVEWGRTKAQHGNKATAQRDAAILEGETCARSELKKIEDRLSGIYVAKRSTAAELRRAKRQDLRTARMSRVGGELRRGMAAAVLPISVEGHIHRLLKEATAHENLAQMYMGWMPFL